MSRSSENPKLARLRELLCGYDNLAVAFSGGVDSTFLLVFAQETLDGRVMAVTASAPNFDSVEAEEAGQFCADRKIRQIRADLGADLLASISHNPPDRCYLCKHAVFSRVLALAKAEGVSVVADGTNADDTDDYRPGIKALAELGVQSPLLEAGLTKQEIREELRRRGLSVWEKPAFACLASRIPYGQEITEQKLAAVAAVEKELHRLGFIQCRVRHHGDVARIELLPEDRVRFCTLELFEHMERTARDAGFTYAALDLAGYRMGSMNANLDQERK